MRMWALVCDRVSIKGRVMWWLCSDDKVNVLDLLVIKLDEILT
jgi:hypothetical protein